MVASDSGPVNLATHWDSVYERAGPTQVSWHQTQPTVSIELIEALHLAHDAAIIDVGGGTSTLVDVLVADGYWDVTVLDVSQNALDATRGRLGPQAETVTWICEDLLAWEPGRHFDVWHDRALFHFLVDAADRARYRDLIRGALRPGGYVVIGTFAPEGPLRCSGLAVSRYDPQDVLEELGADFDLIASRREAHTTPAGSSQLFSWAVLRSKPNRVIGSGGIGLLVADHSGGQAGCPQVAGHGLGREPGGVGNAGDSEALVLGIGQVAGGQHLSRSTPVIAPGRPDSLRPNRHSPVVHPTPARGDAQPGLGGDGG